MDNDNLENIFVEVAQFSTFVAQLAFNKGGLQPI